MRPLWTDETSAALTAARASRRPDLAADRARLAAQLQRADASRATIAIYFLCGLAAGAVIAVAIVALLAWFGLHLFPHRAHDARITDRALVHFAGESSRSGGER